MDTEEGSVSLTTVRVRWPRALCTKSLSPQEEKSLLTVLGCILDHGLLSAGTTRLQPSLVTHCSLSGAGGGLTPRPDPADSRPLHKGGACVFLTRTCPQMPLGAWPIRNPPPTSPLPSPANLLPSRAPWQAPWTPL